MAGPWGRAVSAMSANPSTATPRVTAYLPPECRSNIAPMRISTLLDGKLALLAMLCLSAFGAAHAGDSFRCGSKLVSTGDSRSLVRNRCGTPADITQGVLLRRPLVVGHGRTTFLGDQLVEVQVETWTYNFGPNRLMRRLRFVDGTLEEIEVLDYGYHDSGQSDER
jgi:hypothetical protein